ncbi:N-acetylmuramoyl-L-alanine amidase [Palleronia sp. KMU-117]|uniref:N-acetylmuramoyl-L-alanine amidase n=1 Tax=Palleronia sp. KMU-117 TaxID=3434108 RepID=UPI003D73BE98
MGSLRLLAALAFLFLSLFPALPAAAQGDLRALARVTGPGGLSLTQAADGATELRLTLSQPVPWRVFTLDAPQRVVLDFAEVDWAGVPVTNDSAQVAAARLGVVEPGWSRIVLDLAGPLAIADAALDTRFEDGRAELALRMVPIPADVFAASAGEPESALFRPAPRRAEARTPAAPRRADRPVIVLDPGHGGIDPGAQADGLTEAHLMLTFAIELKEAILRTGSFDVALTRDADVFVPLETRITLARQAGASVFLSLHADALAEGAGSASGATVYTLSDEATDEASLALAERHNRDDLLAGLDLSNHSDEIALILMDLARTETAPRAARLAETVVEGFREAGVKVNSRPLRSAAFSVLKSPDFPSLLIEIGFLSSARDRKRLADPDWRAKAAQGLAAALVDWAAEDAAQARLLRQ